MKPPHRSHGGSGRPSGGRGPYRDPAGPGTTARIPGGARVPGGGERGSRPARDASGENDAARRGALFDPARPADPDRGERRFVPPGADPRNRLGRSESDRRFADRPRGEPVRGNRPHDDRPRDDRPRPTASHPAPARHDRPHPPAPRPPATPSGAVWLYGHHAVAAALANPARRLRRLLATEEAEAGLAARLKLPWPLAPERTERARLDHLLGRDAVHQGVALLADPLAPPPLAQMLDRPGPVLVLDQVSDPRNVGAILRSAAAFGVAGVIAQDRNAPEETGSLAKAASGALETVPLLRAVNIARTLVALKAADRWVVGLDAAGPVPLAGPALAGRKLVLVLGAEGEGLRRLTRETCDLLVSLAMPDGNHGGMESLNVSAAAAVALYEITRRG